MQQRPSHPTDRNRDRYRDRPPRRPPARRVRQPRRPNRDRWYLAGTVAIVGLSLLAFAALVVAGADRFGDGGDDGTLQAAVDQPAPTATVASVIPTPAASPPAATTPTTPPATTSDRPVVCLDVGHGGVDEGKLLLSDDGTEIVAMEKDIVLAQALELRDRLEAQG